MSPGLLLPRFRSSTSHEPEFACRVQVIRTSKLTIDRLRSDLRRGPQAGSFLRPTSKKLLRPRPFLHVLLERYVPATEAPSSARSADDQATTATSAPQLTLGSSSIQVAAPNLDKVRDRLGRVTALRELGADDALVGFLGDGEAEEMRKMGPWSECSLLLDLFPCQALTTGLLRRNKTSQPVEKPLHRMGAGRRYRRLSGRAGRTGSHVSRLPDVLTNSFANKALTTSAFFVARSNRFPGLSSVPVLLPAFQRLTDLNLTATHLPLSDVRPISDCGLCDL